MRKDGKEALAESINAHALGSNFLGFWQQIVANAFNLENP